MARTELSLRSGSAASTSVNICKARSMPAPTWVPLQAGMGSLPQLSSASMAVDRSS
jgi:hypothetical protein